MKNLIRSSWALALVACWLAPARAENSASGEASVPGMTMLGVDNRNPRTLHEYNWPNDLRKQRDYYLENWHYKGSSARLLRLHPEPQIEYKGGTLGGTVNAAMREVLQFKSGVEAFEAELNDGAMAAGKIQADAPRRYLVGQGWKITKKLADVYNDSLVPAANLLYEATEVNNQNLEVLIIIAMKQVALSQAANIAQFQVQLQMIEQIQAEHDRAKGQRHQVQGLLQRGLNSIGEIVPMIEEYDRAYAEYRGGMGTRSLRLVSPAARLAASAAMGIQQANTVAQLADQSLAVAETSEQTAIDQVRKCTQDNIKAAQNPGDSGAQSTAKISNEQALMLTQGADEKRAEARAVVGERSAVNPVSGGGSAEGSARVQYRANDRVNQGRMDAVANNGSNSLTAPLQESLQGAQRQRM